MCMVDQFKKSGGVARFMPCNEAHLIKMYNFLEMPEKA